QAIDTLEAELARPFHAIDRHASIPGVAEIDRAARMHADIIRAVQLLVLEMRGQHVTPAVRAFADKGRGRVLADDQVQLGIVGHAVALVRGTPDLDDATARIPAPSYIARHVGEQQELVDRMPDRSLREIETGADLADRRVRIDQAFEFGPQRYMRHRSLLSHVRRGTSSFAAGSARWDREPDHAAGRRRHRLRSWPDGRGPAADSANCSRAS